MAEAVVKVAGVFRRAGLAVLARLERLEPPRIAAVHRRAGESETRVTVVVDSIMHKRRQVLVAGDVKGKRFANLADCRVALALRPAVSVVVGDKAAFAAVMRRHGGENRLRDDGL